MKPVVIEVFGDKHNKREPEQHRICFPGGEIHIDRTSDNEYWAHIYINTACRHEHVNGDFKATHLASKIGVVVGSRIDYDYEEYVRRARFEEPTIASLPNEDKAQHIAVRIAVVDHEG